MAETTYTYRGGRKLVLEKSPNTFVTRALPEALDRVGLMGAEQVSSASSRVAVSPKDLEQAMAQGRALAPTHHEYTVEGTGQPFLITDRVFVRFQQALPADRVAAFAGRYGLRQVERYSDRDYLFQLTNHTGMNPVKLVVKLTEDDPEVASAENDVNVRARKHALSLPVDPEYARQWHLHGRLNDPEVDARSHARCEDAWKLLDGFGRFEIVVGLTDDGCQIGHPDFDSQGKFAAWGYFQGTRLVTDRDVDADRTKMYEAGSDHGTSCAGVIAGEADAVLTVGGAPGCRLLPVKWESQGPYLLISDSKLLTALNFVADKVDVLSNSWGSIPVEDSASFVVERMTELARTGGRRGRGIVFLWAAGNEDCPIQHEATVMVPYTDGWEYSQGSWVWRGPERARSFRNNRVGIPGVLHVAALASTAQRSHYSNYGTGISLCAPTSNSHAFWRMSVRGRAITTTSGVGSGVTQEFGGTSSATPLTAAVAALVLSANTNLTALEVISILQRTASRDLNMQGYARTPAASFDPDTSWDVSPIAPFDQGTFKDIGHPDGTWSPWFGHGRVDAAAAVAAALGDGPPPPAEPGKEWASAPGLAIPDQKEAGVRDAIEVDLDGALSSIKVSIDITHTFVGDLRVTLIAPSGQSVVLHDRTGGSGDDLRRSYEPSGTPALRSFLGAPAGGEWTLWVQDLAAADRGRLERWSLELGVVAEDVIELSDSPGTPIPDSSPVGIELTLQVDATGRVLDVEVEIDITHTWIGDLVVLLKSPSGTAVDLHRRAGGGTDNLRGVFSSKNVSALAALRGESVTGAWRLHASDHEAQDVGKLNHWRLRIVRQAASRPADHRADGGRRAAVAQNREPVQQRRAKNR